MARASGEDAVVRDLESLLDKYGGLEEANALWARVAGRPFLSGAQAAALAGGRVPAAELRLGGGAAVLLGTAHTSRQSAKAAEAWVRKLRPKALLLERCPERLAELTWPKALVMDSTAALRAVEVAGLGEVSSDALRRIPRPKIPPSKARVEVAQTLATNLWAEFELLNTERNGQVEEAAVDAWTEQLDLDSQPLLVLGDLRASASSVPAGEGGGGPDREALLASLPARDLNLAGAVAACIAASGGPVLAVLGQNHLPGVVRALTHTFGAAEQAAGAPLADAEGRSGIHDSVASWSGAFMRREAVVELAKLRRQHADALTSSSLSPEAALDDYAAAAEAGDALFAGLAARGWAGEILAGSPAVGGEAAAAGLQAWALGRGPWPFQAVRGLSAEGPAARL